ncbi:hypothetical protein CMUS01_01622 [Colletotrichum musicola]|uniref:Uncharacterized protein n=1 Tax=Colletotrichum musicola TaxID=2175873 RepID=A0A8H6U8A9_9PEZI|nr:hypothetical protein CMUS01_01622 [Colletotrichum musicola]
MIDLSRIKPASRTPRSLGSLQSPESALPAIRAFGSSARRSSTPQHFTGRRDMAPKGAPKDYHNGTSNLSLYGREVISRGVLALSWKCLGSSTDPSHRDNRDVVVDVAYAISKFIS